MVKVRFKHTITTHTGKLEPVADLRDNTQARISYLILAQELSTSCSASSSIQHEKIAKASYPSPNRSSLDSKRDYRTSEPSPTPIWEEEEREKNSPA